MALRCHGGVDTPAAEDSKATGTRSMRLQVGEGGESATAAGDCIDRRVEARVDAEETPPRSFAGIEVGAKSSPSAGIQRFSPPDGADTPGRELLEQGAVHRVILPCSAANANP